MVAIEIDVLRGHCLDRRIDSKERLVCEIDARERQRNTSRAGHKMDVHNRESAHQNGARLPENPLQRVKITVTRY
jgi:hypothetical protein